MPIIASDLADKCVLMWKAWNHSKGSKILTLYTVPLKKLLQSHLIHVAHPPATITTTNCLSCCMRALTYVPSTWTSTVTRLCERMGATAAWPLFATRRARRASPHLGRGLPRSDARRKGKNVGKKDRLLYTSRERIRCLLPCAS